MDENTINDVQETVVESQNPEDVQSEAGQAETTESAETAESQEGAAKPQQTREENSQFAQARKQAEAEVKAIKAQNERLLEALKGYGYEGSPEEIADTLLAQMQGISKEEAKAQREQQEKAEADKQKIQSEAEFYKKIAVEKMMADDLAKIQKINPEVKSLNELGEEFGALLGALHDPVLAYDALKAKQARETKPVPQEIGAVNSNSAKEKDFYTSAEVDRLTAKDFDNPKIMEAVRKSMLKW